MLACNSGHTVHLTVKAFTKSFNFTADSFSLDDVRLNNEI